MQSQSLPHISDVIQTDPHESGALKLTEGLANIIRRCWQTEPSARLGLKQVIKLLREQQEIFKEEEE